MEYILKILIVIVVTCAITCGAYYGIHGKLPIPDAAPETTVTKAAAVEKHNDKKLLASLNSDKIYLYKTKKTILLTVDSKQYEFDNWSSNFDAVEPQIYYANFDDDKENEIVIKTAEYKNSDGSYVNALYYLDPVVTSGKPDFQVTYFNKSAWTNVFNSILVMDVRSINSSKKIAQFAINYAGEGIAFDKKTGLATNGYTGYFSTLKNDSGKYLDIDSWSKDNGEYSISADNKIFVDVPVVVNYKGSKASQLAGKIHFQLLKNDKGKIAVGARSMVFIPNSDYAVCDPTVYEKGHWSYTERNADKSVGSDKAIDWIKYRVAYDPSIQTQTISYASTSTDIKNISTLTITEKEIRLAAKAGCAFDEAYKKGEFSVIINEGTKEQYDISYTAEVTADKKGNQTLVITFDKAYPQSQIKTININYGAK